MPKAIVLAAGIGKRMKSDRPKVLTQLLGRPLLSYVLNSLYNGGGVPRGEACVVIGHRGEEVRSALAGSPVSFAEQNPPLGTGHAVQCALGSLDGYEGYVVVTCGDAPLIKPETFAALLRHAESTQSDAVVLTTFLENPASYGRIKRDTQGEVEGIVEFKDANAEERKINEINTGTYCFTAAALRESLSKISNKNAQGEYYLTDTLAILRAKGRRITACPSRNFREFLGINDPADLAEVEAILLDEVRSRHMKSGVVIENPSSVVIEPTVVIGARSRIRPGTILEGRTMVGEGSIIGPGVLLRNVVVPAGSTVTGGSFVVPGDFALVDGPDSGENLGA